MEVSYDVIRRKFPDVYCVDNLRHIYKRNDLSMSFTDFLLYVEDYYLLKYAGTLSKTGWWLFSLLRYLVRYDGFVKLSYKDILNRFRIEGKEAISKPTFFKYVDELESLGLIKRYNNKKLFNTNYQNDSNTYVVLGQVEDIVDICLQVTDRKSFEQLVLGEEVKPEPKKKKKPKSGKSDAELYQEISTYYADIWPEVEKYFAFLGCKNKTKKIALSKKVRIAKFFYERDDYDESILYAMEQAMSRNIDKEAYMFAILRNIGEGEIPGGYYDGGNTQTISSMSEAEYKEQVHELMCGGNPFYYQELLERLSRRDSLNEYEQRLYEVSMQISRKMDIHDANYDRMDIRRDLLDEKYGISEIIGWDKKFNHIIRWQYIKGGKMVPLDVIKQIKQDHPDLFEFYKYEMPDRRYYNGL